MKFQNLLIIFFKSFLEHKNILKLFLSQRIKFLFIFLRFKNLVLILKFYTDLRWKFMIIFLINLILKFKVFYTSYIILFMTKIL